MNDCVVITGSGAFCSLGRTTSEIWDAIVSGKSGVRPIQGFDVQGFDCKVAAQAECPDPADLGIHPRDVRIMDKHSLMLMKCTQDAFTHARLNTQSIAPEDIGFFAGMGMVDYNVESLLPAVLKSIDTVGKIDYDAFYSYGFKEIYPLWPLLMLNNISFCQVSINLQIKGENSVFSPAADSGAQAIAEGFKTSSDKKARVVLAGGVSEKVSPLSLARAHLTGILNVKDGASEATCRPFNANRQGTILGEGCGILAMELRSSADNRGVPYSAKIGGYGFAFETNDDGPGSTATAISRSMNDALDRAGMSPSEIDVVIANGDGMVTGDKNEIAAIHEVFSDTIHDVTVFSSKGALGHLLAGAPAIDTILGIHMVKNGTIPATLNSDPYHDTIQFNVFNRDLTNVRLKKIMINCQSHEGQSASFIIASTD
jgi:3-oxoacyl-[acyl-carrier-protein] synthase II